jgi:hypothetical protein
VCPLGCDPANPHDWNVNAPYHLLESREADDISRVWLVGGSVHCTDADIVSSVCFGLSGILYRVDGAPDDEVVRHGLPHRSNRRIVRAEVHAIGPGGQRDVEPVIDDEQGSGGPHHREELPSQVEELSGARALAAELNGCCATV